MTAISTSADIGAFQTLVRRGDAVVCDHRVHGVRVLPAVAQLDVLYRAAAQHGLALQRLELRDARFQTPFYVLDDDRRLVIRSEGRDGAIDVRMSARGTTADAGGDVAEEAVGACVLATVDASQPPPEADRDAYRAALAADGRTALDELYERAGRLGAERGDFMRASGAIARHGDRLVAKVALRESAAQRCADFLLHPTLLDAALMVATSGLDGDLDGVYLPVSIGSLRAWNATKESLYVDAAKPRRVGPDLLEVELAVYDGGGQPVAGVQELVLRRVRHADLPAALGEADRSPPATDAPPSPASAPEAPPNFRRARPPLDIAIVGMSGRYPDAPDLARFWRNLEAGHDAIREVPDERWRAGDYPTGELAVSRFGGFLTDVDKFDALLFRIAPTSAAALDPQERLFLETAYGAVENAGYKPEDFAPPHNRIGVFVGATWSDYRLLGAEATRSGTPTAMTSTLSSIANRVSFFFNLAGPSMAVDTACSSSLTALHLACRSIADGECDGAIVGGVNLLLHPDKYLLLSQLNMTSSDGRCRSFGAGGDGYVPGEGVGALLLKPAERARADGDTIHGVVLATAVNHGGRAAGFTVPHPSAQADVIARALEQSQVDVESIGYVEAHGTGTSLGDPVEARGLSRAFSGRSRPCALGSVKSNIGHLEAAAGVAAITRTLLQLGHRRIAPSLHSSELNPEIDFAGSPFYVPQEAEDWAAPVDGNVALRRRAGVSSFGAGGANAHVVLEEPSQPAVADDPAEPEIVVLSARSAERLRELAERVAGYLRATDQPGLRDTARTLQVGRPAMEARLACVASTPSDAADALGAYLRGDGDRVAVGTASGTGDASALNARFRSGDLAGAARAWVDGAMPDWAALNGGPCRRLPLPGYPFERRRFWVDEPARRAQPVTEDPEAKEPDMVDADPLDAARRMFEETAPSVADELERSFAPLAGYAATAVLERFREMGYPAAGGSPAHLREQMGIVPAFAPFFDACLAVLERQGAIRSDGAIVDATAPANAAQLRAVVSERFPEATAYLRLLDACIDAYPLTLRGQRSATEVLFPGSSLELISGLYRGNRVYDFYSELVARFVACAAAHRAALAQRPVRILEVGAGTGGASQAALAALARAGTDVEYHYTDIGPSFVAHGRAAFGSSYPFARFGVLDIEKDPELQGYDAHSFDIVLAVGAVHAVADIDETLARIKRLLAPSGLLVLGEAVESHDVMAVTIGLLDGWHLYADPDRRIPNSPLLTVDGWRGAMTRSGFCGFADYGPGLTGDAEPSHRLIVAAAGTGGDDEDGAAPEAEISQIVAAAGIGGDDEDAAALEAEISQIVAAGLAVAPEDVRPEMSFAEYGVDSILAVDLVDRINQRFGLQLKSTVVFDEPSIRALAEHALAQGARPSAEHAGPPATEPTPDDATPSDPGIASRPSQPVAPPEPEPDAIAVIGMSGRFPGAANYRELWSNLVAGRNCVTEVPRERWAVDEYFQPWPPAPGKTYSKWGGYLDDVDRFDPLFFGIVPAEADFIDPQQRLFLEESWKALEDAALDAAELRRVRCGVFAGSPAPDYMTLIRERGLVGSPHVFTGNATSILPARVAYHLDLTGPCYGVDTACSSSLVALHQACRSLAAGESRGGARGRRGDLQHPGDPSARVVARHALADRPLQAVRRRRRWLRDGRRRRRRRAQAPVAGARRRRPDPRRDQGQRRQPGWPDERDHRSQRALAGRAGARGLQALRCRPVHARLRRGARNRHAAWRPDRDRGAHDRVPPLHRPLGLRPDRLDQVEPRPRVARGRRRGPAEGLAVAARAPDPAVAARRGAQPDDRLRRDAVLRQHGVAGVGHRTAPRRDQLVRVQRHELPRGGRGAHRRQAGDQRPLAAGPRTALGANRRELASHGRRP